MIHYDLLYRIVSSLLTYSAILAFNIPLRSHHFARLACASKPPVFNNYMYSTTDHVRNSSDSEVYWQVKFDGGCRAISKELFIGAGGYQITRCASNRDQLDPPDAYASMYFGRGVTSHAAEYLSLMESLYAVHRLLATKGEAVEIELMGDSQQVIEYCRHRRHRLRDPLLGLLNDQVHLLIDSLPVLASPVKLSHIYRTENKEANELANLALQSRRSIHGTSKELSNIPCLTGGLLMVQVVGASLTPTQIQQLSVTIAWTAQSPLLSLPRRYLEPQDSETLPVLFVDVFNDSDYSEQPWVWLELTFDQANITGKTCSVRGTIHKTEQRLDDESGFGGIIDWQYIDLNLSTALQLSFPPIQIRAAVIRPQDCLEDLKSKKCLHQLLLYRETTSKSNDLRVNILRELLWSLSRRGLLQQVLVDIDRLGGRGLDALQCSLMSGDRPSLRMLLDLAGAYLLDCYKINEVSAENEQQILERILAISAATDSPVPAGDSSKANSSESQRSRVYPPHSVRALRSWLKDMRTRATVL